MNSRDQRAEEVFATALEMADPATRRAYLDRAWQRVKPEIGLRQECMKSSLRFDLFPTETNAPAHPASR
jgi:hypothetical protein